jgi:ABC-type Mn2+/Zn2+ transport system ATPase subunit
MLSIRGVELAYGPRTVLRGVDLQVRAGEFWVLIGPNGSGKTTLLQAILGLLAPRSGRIDRDPVRACSERLGFVPQRCDLNPSLPTTVREFVMLGLVGARVSRADRPERLRRALAGVGLEGQERASYWSLSGGQRQRALVARALVRQPDFLILDEPGGGLDVGSQEAFLHTVAELHRNEHLTLLYVTHELSIAARYASHVALFHNGSVTAGPRAEILARPDLEAIFGTPLQLVSSAPPTGATT